MCWLYPKLEKLHKAISPPPPFKKVPEGGFYLSTPRSSLATVALPCRCSLNAFLANAVVTRSQMRCHGYVAHGTSQLYHLVRSLCDLHSLGACGPWRVHLIKTSTSWYGDHYICLRHMGCGGYLGNDWFQVPWRGHWLNVPIGCHKGETPENMHCHTILGCSLVHHYYNSCIIASAMDMLTTHLPAPNDTGDNNTKQLFCCRMQISLSASYLPGVDNIAADATFLVFAQVFRRQFHFHLQFQRNYMTVC